MSAIPLVLTLAAGFFIPPQTNPTDLGNWREPGGSVLRIEHCGNDVCLRIVFLRANPPSRVDIHNPDATQRNRQLCGMLIGEGFHAASPTHADGGTLYDPKSGHTYHGEFTQEGDQLHLRGYIGIPLFGRTETWVRTSVPTAPCPQ